MASPSIVSPGTSAACPLTLRRQPKTQVCVQETGSTTIRQLAQGKGGSGAIVYEYSAHGQNSARGRGHRDGPQLVSSAWPEPSRTPVLGWFARGSGARRRLLRTRLRGE